MTTDFTSNIDEYCLSILRVLLLGFQKFRFNELYKKVGNMGKKMSKPTFSDHIKHLMKRGLVIRKVEGKQNVTYMFNYEKFIDLSETIKTQESFEELLNQQKYFNSLTIDEQVKQVILLMIERNLQQLRLKVLNAIDPSKQFVRNLQLMMVSRTIDLYEKWLLDNCSANKEYGEKVLEKITNLKNKFKSIPLETYEELEKSVPDLIF